MLELRQQVGAAEIESVHMATYGEAVRRTATEAEKWNPETRETADHSIPYLVAAAFQDGGVTPATFAPSRIKDPALRQLIKKLTVVEEPEGTTTDESEGLSPAAIAAAAAAAEDEDDTPWGWIAFACLAVAVVIGGIVWWWRRRSAQKNSEEPPLSEEPPVDDDWSGPPS